ncbi:MAG: hypothetical protein J5590_07890 [Clostridia bacterium]|nr:hypothetical protein [Clostridia bacterium]
MKKLLLILGIVIIVLCVLSLLYAALNMFGYHRVLDGSPQLYQRLHRRMTVFGITGIVLAAVSALCLVFYRKI